MKALKESAGVFEVKQNVVSKLLDIERSIKALELEKKQIIEQIKLEMKESSQDSITSDLATFSYIGEVASKKFDSDRFKKENEALYVQYLKDSTSKSSLRITWKVATDPEIIAADSKSSVEISVS